MVNSEIIEIILKAVDQASNTVENVDNNLEKMGNVGKQANQKMANASKLSQQQINNLSKDIQGVIHSTDAIGTQGPKQFQKYNSKIQDSIVAFNRLDDETQEMLRYLSKMSDEGREAFLGMSSKAQEAVAKFNEMQTATTGWGNTLDITKTKMQLTGVETDSLKGKIQVVGGAVKTNLGDKWDSIKQKVTGFGSHIKTSISSAVSSVRSKIESLGNAFSGLGGIMSSVFGGIGLAGLTNMTIGASVNRDRIKELSFAMLGFGDSMGQFTAKADEAKGQVEGLWTTMDNLTNKSLVSLDQLSQSASVVKQMTGANKDQMRELLPVINDIGQRALLMGKSGEDAMGLMQAAGKGLNGEFQMLQENFGITRDKLESLHWDGTAQDIEGYTQSLQEALSASGEVDGLMDTTSGKLTRLKKYWGLAGRSIGDDFLPHLNTALDGLVKFLDTDNDGALDDRGKKWLQYGYGVMAVGSGFATAAPQINNVFTAFDNIMGVAKSAGETIRGVGSALGFMSSVEELETAAAEANAIAHAAGADAAAASGVASEASAAGHIVAADAEMVAAGAAETEAVSTWALIWPVLALIAAFVAIAVVIYEVGKAFGWWDDVGTMIEAITDGVRRLWEAFINNPDVQDMLKGISDGFKWIVTQISPAIQGVLKFLGVSTNGDFDIVHVIIELTGKAFHMLANAVRAVIPYVQAAIPYIQTAFSVLAGLAGKVWNAFNTVMNILGPFGDALLMIGGPVGQVVSILRKIVCILLGCSPGIVPALQKVQEVFTSVWNAISSFISGVVSTIVSALQPIIDVLSGIGNFLISSFMYAWQTMLMVFNIVSIAVNRIIYIFRMFLSGQINLQTMLAMLWNTLTSMFTAVFSTIISRVTSFAKNMVNKALAMGKQFVTNIINNVKQLPAKVYSQLVAVVSKITSAGSQWVSNAKSKAQSIVDKVHSTLSGLPGKIASALSGVADAIVKPFQDAYNRISSKVDDIKSKALEISGLNFGWELMDNYNAGVDLSTTSTSTAGNENTVTGELTVVHDFQNLPNGVSASEVAEIVLATAGDKEFGKIVANNTGFQNTDLRLKQTLANRMNRTLGV